MPMDYLRSIEYLDLPLRVDDEHAVQCIRVLRAAGMVDATFVASEVLGREVAAVQAITTKGRVALAQHAQGKPFP